MVSTCPQTKGKHRQIKSGKQHMKPVIKLTKSGKLFLKLIRNYGTRKHNNKLNIY